MHLITILNYNKKFSTSYQLASFYEGVYSIALLAKG